MCSVNRLDPRFYSLHGLLSGFAASAQTSGLSHLPMVTEDLRQTVRELALRVSALEEELHKERDDDCRSAAKTSIATLRPIADA